MKATALMYHDICEDIEESGFPGADAAIYKIPLAEFERHLLAIADTKIFPISINEWDREEDSTSLFLTFDDGGKSAMNAADVLDKLGWKGHFFITTKRIGTIGFLTQADILELNKRGHIIGSHSDSHPLRMAALPANSIFEEWRVSVKALEDIISADINTASVPGGHYSTAVSDAAFKNGITFLFTSEPKIRISSYPGGFVLGRYTISKSTNAEAVAGIVRGDSIPRIKQSLIWALKKPLKKIGGEAFLKMRKAILAKRAER